LELLQLFGCHAFKLCTQFERNGIIYGRVIDDLARFRRAILGVRQGHNWRSFIRDAWNQLCQTWRGHRAIIAALYLFQSSDILLHFHTRVIQRWVMLKTTPNVARFAPPPLVKSKGGVNGISIPIFEALLYTFIYSWTSGIHFMAIHCTRLLSAVYS